MTDPVQAYVVGVTVSNADEGLKVKFTNLTTGGNQVVALDSNKKATCDFANLSSYAASDVIRVEIHGREVGVVSSTIAGGGRDLTLTSANDASVSVSL